MIDKIKKDIYNNWFIILIVIIYLLFMQIVFSTWCPIKAFFHADCPGCGLTHAIIYMFKGQFIKAFNENYTVFLWWGLIIIGFIDRYIYKLKIKVFPHLFIFVCIVTMFRYFFKLLFL